MKKKKLTAEQIIEHTRQMMVGSHSLEEVLDLILRVCAPVDFTARCPGSQLSAIPLWQLQVVVVQEVLRLVHEFGWGLCRYKEYNYLYNGSWWMPFEEPRLLRLLGEAAELMGIESLRAHHADFRSQLVSQFISLADLRERTAGPMCINLANGTLDIDGDMVELRSYDRDDFLTYQLPFMYDPKAGAPRFKAFLNKVLPEEELQHILAEYLGYIFVPQTVLKLEKALLLYGQGANGKSVFFDIVNALLGPENVTNFNLASLTESKGYYRAMLGNKLLNYASEISRHIDPAFFKQLVSGEPIEARLPYGNPFTLQNYARLMFNTNELPKDVEHSLAYFRRLLIIPFRVTIPDNEQDAGLATAIIANELPGILNWVLEGLKRLQQNRRFTTSTIIEQEVAMYQSDADTCRLFVEEYDIRPDGENHILLKDMYGKYSRFCKENNYYAYSNRTFKKHLINLKFPCNRHYDGIRVGAVGKMDEGP